MQTDTLSKSARLLRESNGDVKVADAKLRPVRYSVVLGLQRFRFSSLPDGVPAIEEEADEEREAPLFADANPDANVEAVANGNPDTRADAHAT